MKLCLGTVQFGMPYGIGNLTGQQPLRQDCFTMLDEAMAQGIDCIDTAFAYGQAEELLGEYGIGRKNVKVISKLCPNIVERDEKDIQGILERELKGSLQRMKLDSLDGYLFHTPEYITRPAVVEALLECKRKQLTKQVGVSVYEVEHAFCALDIEGIDYIQAPFSILDQRMERSGFLQKAKEKGVTVFLRSAFLQGLFFIEPANLPSRVEQTRAQLAAVSAIVNEHGFSLAEAALRFVLKTDADYLVFGVDTLGQLQENLRSFDSKSDFSACRTALYNAFPEIDKSIIFPSLWKEKKVERAR